MRLLTVDERGDGQRLDNFVRRHCPDVPKTRLYRAMRKGEIRVNKGRVRPDRRLALGAKLYRRLCARILPRRDGGHPRP